MTLDGLINNERVYFLRDTYLYGQVVQIANIYLCKEDEEADVNERVGFVLDPESYEYKGMDEYFRKVYEKRGGNDD